MPKTTAMTKAERLDLGKVVRLRMKVSRAAVDRLAAERRAEVEAQLSAIHPRDAAAWSHITAEAEHAVQEADAKIAAICRERDIPERFRPELRLLWYGRGENAVAARRAELRALAVARIDAYRKAAYQRIEAWGADRLTTLHSGSLTSAEARDFLASLPEPAQLVPHVSVRMSLTEGGELVADAVATEDIVTAEARAALGEQPA